MLIVRLTQEQTAQIEATVGQQLQAWADEGNPGMCLAQVFGDNMKVGHEIRDAVTRQMVRSQITPPSEQDCIDAVRQHRETFGVHTPTAVGRRKRVDLKL